jgi:hypothetical protein
MRLSQIDNQTIDYKTSLAIKQDAKEAILLDAANKGILVDYSALENDDENDLREVSDVNGFFNDMELVL